MARSSQVGGLAGVRFKGRMRTWWDYSCVKNTARALTRRAKAEGKPNYVAEQRNGPISDVKHSRVHAFCRPRRRNVEPEGRFKRHVLGAHVSRVLAKRLRHRELYYWFRCVRTIERKQSPRWRGLHRQHARRVCSPESREATSQAFRNVDHVLRVDAALLHHFGTRRAQAEFVQADDFSIKADVLVPNLGHAGFNGHASATFVRQDLLSILLRLAIEPFEARH